MKLIRSETVRNKTFTLLYSTVNNLFLQDLKYDDKYDYDYDQKYDYDYDND